MSKIGRGAIAGGACGYFLVAIGIGVITGSNTSGLAGLLIGLPLGMIIGIIATAVIAGERDRNDIAAWTVVAVILILIMAIIGAVGYVNWKSG